MNITIAQQHPDTLRDERAALVEAFGAIFAIDQATAASFVVSLDRHSTYPGFRFFAARDADAGDALLGFAYGYTSGPGQWLHDQCAAVLGEAQTKSRLTGAFESVEFGVVPTARDQGIGARLYDATFAGLPHRAAILSTQRDNATAIGFYERRGWRYLADLPGGDIGFALWGLDRVGSRRH